MESEEAGVLCGIVLEVPENGIFALSKRYVIFHNDVLCVMGSE